MGKKNGMPYSRLEFISGAPGVKISKFKLGAGEYDFGIRMVSQENGLVRQEALEAARIAINNRLQKLLGEENYVLVIRVFPHIILREHRFLTGAGADRLSQGMKKAFGRPTTRAARISNGQVILEVYSDKKNMEILKQTLKAGAYKLPLKIRLEEINKGEA